jgi:hypothetical protein
MSFDDEHHWFVLLDDGETSEKPENARGVDHIGFSCGGPSELANEYERDIPGNVCAFHLAVSAVE